jgi:hypothetical protein
MPGKMARSTPQPPFGPPDALVAVLTSRLSCRTAGNTRTFTPAWESFGESRLKRAIGPYWQIKLGGLTLRNVDLWWGDGFIGANLSWNFVLDLNDSDFDSGGYWDVCLIPRSANESLTINRKTFSRPADGSLRFFINVINNTANDTFYDSYLVRIG